MLKLTSGSQGMEARIHRLREEEVSLPVASSNPSCHVLPVALDPHISPYTKVIQVLMAACPPPGPLRRGAVGYCQPRFWSKGQSAGTNPHASVNDKQPLNQWF